MALSTTYLLPAFLLNPIFLLHTANTLLARLPFVSSAPPPPPPHVSLYPARSLHTTRTYTGQSPLTPYGPHPLLPYFDIHASDALCWIYTLVVVLIQIVVFSRVSGAREQRLEEKKRASESDKSYARLPGGDQTVQGTRRETPATAQ